MIRRASAAILPSPVSAPAFSAALRIRRRTSQDWLILHYNYLSQRAEFAIRKDGRCINVHADGGVSDANLATLLEAAILGGSARLLGHVCLHATLLTDKGRAVALMGPSRAGKSSLAWTLLSQGCRLLSDDVALLNLEAGKVMAHPGRMRLRLWPEAASPTPAPSPASNRFFPGCLN
jgi:hypothetical protein